MQGRWLKGWLGRFAIPVATAGLAVLFGSGSGGSQPPTEPVKVVATFSILADFVKNVGEDRVEIRTLVGPGTDAHVYAPSPQDARALAQGRVVFVNGLGYEGWIDRLVAASATRARVVRATAGVRPRALPDGGGLDPHAWQSAANAKLYVENIREGLAAADPARSKTYSRAAGEYAAKLDALDHEVRAAFATIPPERRKLITSHNAFGYFQDAYGIAFIAPQGVSTETEASARTVAAIIRQVRAEKVPAVFLENVTDPRVMQRIASESGAKIGGTLYSDALTTESGPAPTYIEMMRHNVRLLVQALKD